MSNVNYELVKNRTIELSTCYYFPLRQKLANEKVDLLGHDLFAPSNFHDDIDALFIFTSSPVRVEICPSSLRSSAKLGIFPS